MAIPTEHVKRAYAVYLRGPALDGNRYAFSLTDTNRNSIQHQGLMVSIPTPADSFDNDFGILVGGSFTVEIGDEDNGTGGADGLGGDWFVLLEDGGRIIAEDGGGALIQEY